MLRSKRNPLLPAAVHKQEDSAQCARATTTTQPRQREGEKIYAKATRWDERN